MRTVALVDLGMGNLHSVRRALERASEMTGLEIRVERTSDPEALRRADQLVVPGQGAFRDCAAALAGGLGEALRDRIAAGVPFLGICLGLQALFATSEEAEGALGLGIFPGSVRKLAKAPGVKIPHMGWNQVEAVGAPHPVLRGDPTHFYFVHSYHAVPDDPALVCAVTDHGPNRVTAAIARDNVLATQFHPEKSQAAGLELLSRFLG